VFQLIRTRRGDDDRRPFRPICAANYKTLIATHSLEENQLRLTSAGFSQSRRCLFIINYWCHFDIRKM
ncbi:uncharacterized protein METZ01_LOCUS167269, partial [marine metagenome]